MSIQQYFDENIIQFSNILASFCGQDICNIGIFRVYINILTKFDRNIDNTIQNILMEI